jgi:hypothetical protein
MIEISVSRELAAAHPRFMAGCADRGLRVEVFGGAERNGEARAICDPADSGVAASPSGSDANGDRSPRIA